MTDLQQKVLTAIQSGKTDEEKTNLSLNAVRMWYFENGYFHRSYEIGAQIVEN